MRNIFIERPSPGNRGDEFLVLAAENRPGCIDEIRAGDEQLIHGLLIKSLFRRKSSLARRRARFLRTAFPTFRLEIADIREYPRAPDP
jgi:hypothetical protein